MDPSLLQALFDNGVGVVLAVGAMYWIKTSLQHLLDEANKRNDYLINALNKNSEVLTETVETMRSLRSEVQTCPLRVLVEEQEAANIGLAVKKRRNSQGD